MNNKAQITISADNQAGRGIDQARRDLGELGNTAERTGRRSRESFDRAAISANSFSGSISRLYTSLAGVMALVGGGALARSFIEAASALEEVQNKFDVVFRGMTEQAEMWAANLQQAFFMSEREAKSYLASIQDLLVPMGMVRSEAGEMANKIVQLSADLASFNNLPTAQVMGDIQSALVGEYEPMRKYGVVLQATTVQQQALNMGLAETKDELTAGNRALAAYSMMVRGSADAVGDLDRSSGSYANQMRLLTARIEDTKTALGEDLLPIATEYVSLLSDWIDQNDELIKQKFSQTIEDTASAIQTLVGIYQTLPDGVVGAAGVGILGRFLTGSTPIGQFAAALYLINTQLKNYGLNIGHLADNYKELEEQGQNFWEVLSGKRDWNTGELKDRAEEWARIITATGEVWIQKDQVDAYFASLNKVSEATEKVGDTTGETAEDIEKALADANKGLAAYYKELEASQKAMDKITLASMPEYERGIQEIIWKYEELTGAVRTHADTVGMSVEDEAALLANLGLRRDEELANYVASTKTTTTEISRIWDHMFERLQDLTADWLKDWEFSLDSLKDLAKSVAAQIASYWIWGDQSKGFSFANMFGGSMAAEAAGGNATAPALQTAGMTGTGGGFNFGSLTSLGTSAMQGLGNVGNWMMNAPANLTGSLAQTATMNQWGIAPILTKLDNLVYSLPGALSGALTAGIGTFVTRGLMSGEWGAAAVTGLGAAGGAALGTMILPGIGTVIGGILGSVGGEFLNSLFGGDGKKRSGFFEQATYSKYSLEGGWGAPEEDVIKRKRDFEQFEESITDTVAQSVEWVNSIDSMFKGLLGAFGGDYKTRFTTSMAELAATRPSMMWGIDAQDEDEVAESMYANIRRLGETLIDPIVQEGQQLLAQALDDSISESSIWGYFTDSMQTHIRTSLSSSLEDLQVDWSKVVDENSLNAAIEQMEQAGQSVTEIISYFNQIGAVMDDLAQRIALHGYASNVQSAVMELDSINSEFTELGSTLQALGVDLEKYTDLQTAYNLAIQDWLNQTFAGAISYAGTSAGWQAMVPQTMSSTDQWLAQYQHVQDLTSSYDGTTASAIELSDALGVLSGMSYDLAAEMQSAIAHINESYSSALESMYLETLSDQQKYDWYKSQTANADALLANATSVEEITRIADDVLQWSTAGFGMLSDEQKRQLYPGFKEFLADFQADSTSRIEQLGGAMDDANASLTKAADIIVGAVADIKNAAQLQITAADKQDAAADGQVAAANAQISAAGTPVTVTVNLDSSDVG